MFSAVAQRRPVVVGEPQRHLEVKNIEQLDEVVGPAGGNGAGAHGVFERQIPADDPGEDFAERGVGVGVGAARQRNHGGEFRIAQRRQRRNPSPERTKESIERRAGVMRAEARQHENARADDRADAQRGELKRARACASGCARLFLSPPRAARSSASWQTNHRHARSSVQPAYDELAIDAALLVIKHLAKSTQATSCVQR